MQDDETLWIKQDKERERENEREMVVDGQESEIQGKRGQQSP
jgi:hypothetical protein